MAKIKFPGISDELRKIIDADMDFVAERRTAREAFKDTHLSIDHVLFKTPNEDPEMKESYEVNSRKLEIFTKSWLPKTNPPKAVVCLCTFFLEGVARKIALSGYAVFAMDYPGFGLSEDGDLADLAFKDEKKREQATYNVIAYKHKPRLWTGLELLKTTEEIEQQLQKVSVPLLILHGKADVVTDPSVSNALYEKASSSDKNLVLCDDGWHGLLEGETDEAILKVLSDITTWLDEHVR